MLQLSTFYFSTCSPIISNSFPCNCCNAVLREVSGNKTRTCSLTCNAGKQGVLCAQVHASLIVVLTRGGSTARLVAKYRPSIPVLTVAVPVLTTDSLTWTCSGEAPARQCLVTRGLLPLLAEGSARATDTDTTDEILQVTIGCFAYTLHHVCMNDVVT